MIEVTIRITGNTLLNDKVDELIKAARQIQETEENLDTKMEIKKKKEKVKKEPKKSKKEEEETVEDFEEVKDTEEEEDKEDNDVDVEEDEEDEEDSDVEEDEDEDISSVEDLKKEAKNLFIKLTKKDKPKAKALLGKYDVGGFSELEEVFEDSTTKWEKLIKTLNKYVG